MGFQGADPALNRFYLRDPMKMTKKVAQKATSAALDVAKQTADVSMAAARQAQGAAAVAPVLLSLRRSFSFFFPRTS